jgi:hypothetical protein
VVTRILACLLAALLALPLTQSSPPAKAGKRFKNITRTFSNNGQIAILASGEANPYPATLQVGGFKKAKKAKIKDVDLVLRDFSHEFPDEVDILLVAPNGRNALVMSDVGGNAHADNLTLTLDDEAGAGLPLDSQLSSGTFRPTNDGMVDTLPAPAPVSSGSIALSVFNGADPSGQWRLFIRDDDPGDNGSIAGGFSLEIKAKVKKKKKR